MPPPESVSSATVTDLATARRGRTAASRDAAPPATAPSAATPNADTAKKTPRKPANRRFDTEKVERLKAEIAEGRYEIDPTRVADRFIEHERNG